MSVALKGKLDSQCSRIFTIREAYLELLCIHVLHEKQNMKQHGVYFCNLSYTNKLHDATVHSRVEVFTSRIFLNSQFKSINLL